MTNWGVISTGHIARAFARGIEDLPQHRIVAVGSRSQESANAFGDEFGITQRCSDYADVLACPEVDAVYIGTPHPFHAEWCIKAAEAGKHILCEKPAGMNRAEVVRMIHAARHHDVFFMEAFMYRCNPQTARVVELIQQGAIGRVQLVRADFCFNREEDPSHRLFNRALGGGSILDVGCYTVSFARHIAGAAIGQSFDNPVALTGHGTIGKTGVDEWASAHLFFKSGIEAQCHCALRRRTPCQAAVLGTDGWIEVPVPWACNNEDDHASFTLHRWGHDPEPITVPTPFGKFATEIEYAARHFDLRQAPNMSWEDSLGNAEALDQWLGEVY